MNMQEFSRALAQAAKNLPAEKQEQLLKLFLETAGEAAPQQPAPAAGAAEEEQGDRVDERGIPLGMTPRLKKLKENYMKQRPSISIHAARAKTKIMRENPGMPAMELRGKAFRYSCETAPLVIQDDELIVGAPCGAPRAGAFSPDIAWRWLRDELDTVGTRPQDPFYISEEDKRICREELFRLEREGIGPLLEELRAVDPQAAARIAVDAVRNWSEPLPEVVIFCCFSERQFSIYKKLC